MVTWRLAVSLVVVYFAFRAHWGLGALMFGLAAFALSEPIVEAGACYLQWAQREPYAAWQGDYYEFANRQIRFFAVGKELWAVDADFLGVIGQTPSPTLASLHTPGEYARIPETKFHGFSPAGAEKILRKSTHRESNAMWLWLQREVYGPHARKIEVAKMPRVP